MIEIWPDLPAMDEQTDPVSRLDHRTSSLDLLACEAETAIQLQLKRRAAPIFAAVTAEIDARGFAPKNNGIDPKPERLRVNA